MPAVHAVVGGPKEIVLPRAGLKSPVANALTPGIKASPRYSGPGSTSRHAILIHSRLQVEVAGRSMVPRAP